MDTEIVSVIVVAFFTISMNYYIGRSFFTILVTFYYLSLKVFLFLVV